MDDLDKRIAEANDEFILEEEAITPALTDLYDERQKIQRDYSQKQFPRGSREQVLATVQDVINGAGTRSLGQAYKRARDDSEALEKMGDHRRAQLVRNQYMQESFLPAVEVVVNFTSPDELLNCSKGLSELDKLALGNGPMFGYTAAYIREAYGNSLGRVEPPSSPMVSNAVMRLNGLLDSDQMVSAKGLANKIKKKIDAGETISNQEDYQFILMIANGK